MVVMTAGCSHGRVEMQKRLTELTHEVTKLRASNLALQDRVDALEAKAPRTRSSARATDEQPDGRPNLEVVRLAPEAPEVAPPPVETPPESATKEPRPIIRGDESGVEQVKKDEGAKAKRQLRRSRQR